MKPHVYNGNGLFCLQCFKSKVDPIHTCDITLIVDNKPTSMLHTCSGHICPKCDSVWTHDYQCNKPEKKAGLCHRCAGETAVLINRPTAIQLIDEVSHGVLDPKRVKEIQLTHKDFVVLNIFHLPDGSDNPNWLEDGSKHYKDLEAKIQQFKIQQSSYMQAKAEKQYEDATKLSPEEREAFERDAKRLKEKTSKLPSLDKRKEEWRKAMDKIADMLRAINPKLTEAEALEQAKGNLQEPK